MLKPATLTLILLLGSLAVWPLAAAAETMEVQGPDGRTILLFDDKTWDYKPEPAVAPSEPTVDRDDLVLNPDEYVGQQVIVSGKLVEAFGAYRLTSKNGQNNIVVDVEQLPAAEQNRLEDAFDEAGWTGAVPAQIHGVVEEGTFGHRILASQVLLTN